MKLNELFDSAGYLLDGLHLCSSTEFLETFCSGDKRQRYFEAVKELLDFASKNGAERVIFGGSFLNVKLEPKDVDCIMVFQNENSIPEYLTCNQHADIAYDVIFASREQHEMVDSYVKIFSLRKDCERKRGIADVYLGQGPARGWEQNSVDDEELRKALASYAGRTYIERNHRKGVVVLIPGVNTRAEWISRLTPMLNKKGWIVAPYLYNNQKRLFLFWWLRKDHITRFRKWINELKDVVGDNHFSVVAHSFGTYIITKYIDLFKIEDRTPIVFDAVILTGSILNPKYDWNKIPSGCLNRVVNVITKNDGAVKWLKFRFICNWIFTERLFGNSAIVGFSRPSSNLLDKEWDILTHCDVFEKDFVRAVLIPHLEYRGF